MKFFLMPKEPTWWIWLVTAALLAVGLAAWAGFFIAALALSAGQCVFFLRTQRALTPYAVQIRLAYTTLLAVCFVPVLRWLYWLPTLGTFALVLFGYCLVARVLSLAPWNRREPLTVSLLQRTFCAAPIVGRADHGLPVSGCPGGVCEREARVASLQTQKPG
jgi:hypothetical protein